MSEEIIINGVDVSDCKNHKSNGKCRIPHYQQNIKYVSCNCNEWDCDYKQLKRLQEENKKLKEVTNEAKIEYENLLINRNNFAERAKKLEQERDELQDKYSKMIHKYNDLYEKYRAKEILEPDLKNEIKKFDALSIKYGQALEEIRSYCDEQNLKADYTACYITNRIDEVLKCQ